METSAFAEHLCLPPEQQILNSTEDILSLTADKRNLSNMCNSTQTSFVRCNKIYTMTVVCAERESSKLL